LKTKFTNKKRLHSIIRSKYLLSERASRGNTMSRNLLCYGVCICLKNNPANALSHSLEVYNLLYMDNLKRTGGRTKKLNSSKQ